MLLGPKGPLRCWFVGGCAPLVCWGTRVGGATAYAPPGATIGGECATAVRASVRAPSFGPGGPFGGRMPLRPGVSPPRVSPPRVSPWAMVRRPYRPPRRPSIRAHGPVWGAYAIRPYRGTCIRVPSGTRPNSPASADARPYRGTCIRVFGQLPCPGRGCPQTPGLSYVLIGISVRLHLAFASGFLSVCEGKGLYVRRACQYVILRISSRPCAWPECSFYRCPICCLSAPYTAHGVSEIREP